MSEHIKRVSTLTALVNKLIEVGHKENELDETVIKKLIDSALSLTGTASEYNNDDITDVIKNITCKYQIFTTPGESIVSDYEQDSWYDDRKSEIEPFFWQRYRNYLIDEKHFSPNVVTTLGEEILDQKLMNYIIDPETEANQQILRKGLIIGDVQSGKTSTYIGFMCKAADAGYKVFILLTGTIESLRKQTQERVEEGFIGIDMSSDNHIGKRVGVGLDNKPIMAWSMTSRKNDFTGNSDKNVIPLVNALNSKNNAVVFVIKKNITTLTKLKEWLVTLNATNGRIDLPMLMIDDEADNASINTSKDKEDPTKINRLIRELADIFTKSNYVGFTATPFANVFIDPEKTETMMNQDLFPEDFIVALPTPNNYIGAEKIFEENGEYHSQLIYINDAGNEKKDGFPFYFLHNKEWHDELPESLTDAVYTFYLANALRDLRGDKNTHRSMLINISTFVKVQKYIGKKTEEIHSVAYRSVKFNLSTDFTESMKNPVLRRIYDNWTRYYSNTEADWNDIVRTLYNSIKDIRIKVVNSSRDSERLDYPENRGIRVIVIGGQALSRGLTLEGLVISYFYRNTKTYDVLMQMGRWFGYRKGYEDLFRIWTHKTSADWYAEISQATRLLKDDMHNMHENNQKPKDFGIRVRNDSEELRITAYNKMRNSIDAFEFTSYFGSFFETPYLPLSADANRKNFDIVSNLVRQSVSEGKIFERENASENTGRYVIRCIPKHTILNFLYNMNISEYCARFDKKQIINFLSDCQNESLDFFDLVFIEGKKSAENKPVEISGRNIYPVSRNKCTLRSDYNRLEVGQRGKLSGPDDSQAGITDFNGHTKEQIIRNAITDYKEQYFRENGTEFTKKVFPTDTWFKFVKDRKPVLFIYLIEVNADDGNQSQKLQIEDFRKQTGNMPVVGLAMGIPKNDSAEHIHATKYKANKIYNWFEKDEIIRESEGDIE